jgi:Methyltransferase domain
MNTQPDMIVIVGARPENGHCWQADLPAQVSDGDSPGCVHRSGLRLFENGTELGPPYALHDDIRRFGGGRYSHWGRSLYFSASDNSSPLLNGREYSVLVKQESENNPEGLHRKPVNFLKRSPDQFDEDVEYAVQVSRHYLGHLSKAGLRPEGLRILELGPGVNFAPQLFLASLGARMAVADRFLVSWDDDYHPHLYQAFRKRWDVELPAIDRVLRDGDHSPEVISCFPSPAENLSDVDPAAFDVVISNAVLEHVYSMPSVCGEMARVTAFRGLNMHQIDFRDHSDFSRPLEFLTVPDEEYDKEFKRSNGERGNRLRPSETERLFEDHRFEMLSFDADIRCDPNYFADFIPRLRTASSRYRNWPEDDLHIISGRMVFRKSA